MPAIERRQLREAGSGPGPEISVITASHRRRDLLLRKLDSLTAQSLAPERFEWIVFVSGDDDGSVEALRRAETPFRLVLLESDELRPAGVARNRAVASASSPLLHLSDDDCLLEPGVLEALLSGQRRPGVVLGGISFEWEGERERFAPRRAGYWQFNGANTTLPADAFARAGGFDETLRGYGGEDLLLGYRLHLAGLDFRARPDIVVRHIGPNPLRGRDRTKAASAGRNAVRIARRHPELAVRLGVHPLQLALKQLLRVLPDRGRLGYERHYLAGALTERRLGPRLVASNDSGPPRSGER